MQSSINRDGWRTILSTDLPGEEAQKLMAPTFRGEFSHLTDPVPAAVLILLYPSKSTTNLVLIKRNTYNGHHSAQVSLPGGRWEETDGSLEQTAIRETREELGIVEDIEILGSMTELHIPVSNFQVSPFVGCTERTPVFEPDLSEVQYIIEVPLIELQDPFKRGTEIIYRNEHSILAPFYRVGNEKVWGATAMMLSEFLQLASRQQSLLR